MPHPNRGCEVKLKDLMRLAAYLVEVKQPVSRRVPTHGKIGSDQAHIQAAGSEQFDRFAFKNLAPSGLTTGNDLPSLDRLFARARLTEFALVSLWESWKPKTCGNSIG